MTELILDRAEINTRKAEVVGRIFTIVLLVLGVWASASSLSFAVHHRIAAAQEELVSTSDVTTAMRERQLTCLAQNIYHEAGGEPFEGKVAVAQVVINRTTSGQFPGDICRTIQQKTSIGGKVICQFSWMCETPSQLRPINPTAFNESMNVAKKVLLEGFKLDGLKEAMYFHAESVPPNRPSSLRLAKIGHHIFYK